MCSVGCAMRGFRILSVYITVNRQNLKFYINIYAKLEFFTAIYIGLF